MIMCRLQIISNAYVHACMHACMHAEFYVWFVSIYKDIDTEESVVKRSYLETYIGCTASYMHGSNSS